MCYVCMCLCMCVYLFRLAHEFNHSVTRCMHACGTWHDTGGGCGAIDGFVVVNVISVTLGVLWFVLFRRRLLELEGMKLKEWQTKTGRLWIGTRRSL